ncbi:MAG TPA: CopD family protein [Geminicoccaceae bacterium]|nr:CopD family protein [Geminicoccaceae bacterium]
MSDLALWLKALHIMAFTAWMAGLWYLPRLFVYHSQVAIGSEASEKYKVMERRLLRGIATPAMLAAIAFGIALGLVEEQWPLGWLQVKTVLVLGLAGVHGALARSRKAFAADRRPASERFFRAFNELPTLLFVAIVLVTVLRPF